MATFLVNTTITTTGTGSAAYNLASGDAVLVDRSGTLAGLGMSGYGLALYGNNSTTVRGTVFAASIGIVEFGTPTAQKIVVAEGALVNGTGSGAILSSASGASTFTNQGEVIGGSQMGLSIAGTQSQIFNGGLMSGGLTGLNLAGTTALVTNTGSIQGGTYGIRALSGGASIVNEGLIAGTGPASSGLYLVGGGHTVTNAGTISAIGNETIQFDGSGGLGNVLDNLGLIATTGNFGAVTGGDGADTLRNSGTILGAVVLDAGDDLFDGRTGIQSLVRGDAGNDTMLGGAGDEMLLGGNDGDSLEGGAGDDTLRGGAGPDTLDGGAGDRDLLDYMDSVNGAVDVDLLFGTASGGDAAGDVFANFEWVAGGDFADTIAGHDAANRLFGRFGADALSGAGGNDTLVGGDGADTLTGGLGADVLTGGAGNDRFRFLATADSTGQARDRITDFASVAAGGSDRDRIDLSAIDAIVGGGPNDTFAFIGGAAFTAAGQLRVRMVGDLTYAFANTDANSATVELTIVLNAGTLTAGDFIL